MHVKFSYFFKNYEHLSLKNYPFFLILHLPSIKNTLFFVKMGTSMGDGCMVCSGWEWEGPGFEQIPEIFFEFVSSYYHNQWPLAHMIRCPTDELAIDKKCLLKLLSLTREKWVNLNHKPGTMGFQHVHSKIIMYDYQIFSSLIYYALINNHIIICKRCWFQSFFRPEYFPTN